MLYLKLDIFENDEKLVDKIMSSLTVIIKIKNHISGYLEAVLIAVLHFQDEDKN